MPVLDSAVIGIGLFTVYEQSEFSSQHTASPCLLLVALTLR